MSTTNKPDGTRPQSPYSIDTTNGGGLSSVTVTHADPDMEPANTWPLRGFDPAPLADRIGAAVNSLNAIYAQMMEHVDRDEFATPQKACDWATQIDAVVRLLEQDK
jgi:hypothetical protein